MSQNIITMSGIGKQFNHIWVLKDINFEVNQGEVHAIFGENGAGKSVLMKILSGVLQPDEGEVSISGKIVSIDSPEDSQRLGIRTMHQEQNLFPYLSVAENIFISQVVLRTNMFNIIRRGKICEDAEAILKGLGSSINPRKMLKDLGAGERQMVQIAKTLACNSNVIIMDEPTGSLTEYEIEKLFEIIRNLKAKGISIIYISHRIEEVLKIANRITIIRDGKIVRTDLVENINKERLISLSAGKDFKERYPKLPVQKGRVFFKAVKLSSDKRIKDISFEVRKGEILGIAGLVGSGRTAIARAIFGADRLTNGEIYINNTKLNIKSPRDAIKAGIGYVTEDRLSEGLIEEFNIQMNITLTNLKETIGRVFLKTGYEREVARKYIKKLVIKTPCIEQKVKNLSGGNQQKIVLAKWLFRESKLFIFDEPTVGLDTGSKVEVYNIMNEIALNNSGIILISSDLSELVGMSDRILVIYNGQIRGELSRNEFSMEKLLTFASGDN